MRTPLIGFLFLLCNILYVRCTPLPLDLRLPKNFEETADGHRVMNAHWIANEHIDAMHKVVSNPHEEKHREILDHTFGKHHDLKEIKKRVDKLRDGVVHITDLRDKKFGATQTGGTVVGKGTVRLGAAFHSPKRTDVDRAGTLIHEASHSLFNSVDFFSKNGKKPLSKVEAKKDPKSAISGMMNQKRYNGLKKDPSTPMYLNADSWKAFGFHAATGKPHPDLSMRSKSIPPSTKFAKTASVGRSTLSSQSRSQSPSPQTPTRGRTLQRETGSGRSQSQSTSRSPSQAASRGRTLQREAKSPSQSKSPSASSGQKSPSSSRSPSPSSGLRSQSAPPVMKHK